jgi:hypothetical protein
MVFQFLPPIKLIAIALLLKVALNTKPTYKYMNIGTHNISGDMH